MSHEQLLPCPCCGEPVTHTSYESEPERIDCICGISMEAITWPVLLVKWNRRAAGFTRAADRPEPGQATAEDYDMIGRPLPPPPEKGVGG